MKRLAEERELPHQRVEKLNKEIENSEALLSNLATSLWGDHASTLIMSQLEPDDRGSDDILPP